jgi:methionyl-tRNA formyltransferase
VARIGYLGTPELAVAPLKAILDAGHEVPLVISTPDVRRGRGSAVSPSPVKTFALERGLAVSDDLAALEEVGLDLCVVVAYGRIIPAPLLEKIPMVNLHFSLLPRWRGAAPVERAILEGDVETGVCVMAVEPELDTGGIYAVDRVAVGDKSLAALRGELVERGIELLLTLIADLPLPPPVPQEGEANYAKKITAGELALDFSAPAEHLRRQIALGRAYCFLGQSRLRILEARVSRGGGARPGELEGSVAATADGGLELVLVQPEGKRPLAASDWLRGLRSEVPVRLGPEASL